MFKVALLGAKVPKGATLIYTLPSFKKEIYSLYPRNLLGSCPKGGGGGKEAPLFYSFPLLTPYLYIFISLYLYIFR